MPIKRKLPILNLETTKMIVSWNGKSGMAQFGELKVGVKEEC